MIYLIAFFPVALAALASGYWLHRRRGWTPIKAARPISSSILIAGVALTLLSLSATPKGDQLAAYAFELLATLTAFLTFGAFIFGLIGAGLAKRAKTRQ